MASDPRSLVASSLPSGHIEFVEPSFDYAISSLEVARLHLESAETISETDLVGAYQLVYDAVRKSIQGFLGAHGLRITAAGGHYAYVRVSESGLFVDPAFNEVRQMRILRNAAEYPEATPQQFESSLVIEAKSSAQRIVAEIAALIKETRHRSDGFPDETWFSER